MQNFEFEHNGQKLWYSRSLACNAILLSKIKGELCVLACKRGQGCEFHKGLWNVPGGFIDFDEDAKDAARRELFEETGVKLDRSRLWFFRLDTTPRSKRQTMIASFVGIFDSKEVEKWCFSTEYSEPDETEEIRWISINEIDNYDWLSGQKEVIREACKNYF